HVDLVAPVEQRVRVLHERRSSTLERLADAGRVVVREPPRADEALLDEPLEAGDGVRERRAGVRLVCEVEIDTLDAEPAEARLELPPDPVGREPGVGGIADGRVEDLRRQGRPVPPLGDPAPDPRLAAAAAVAVGRVEPRDARVPGAVHDPHRLVLRDALTEERGRGADAAEVAAAERDPFERHSGRFIRVSSFRTSQSSGKNEWWIRRPITSTGVPCVPITSPPITRWTTLKWRTRHVITRSSSSISCSAS